MKFINKLKRINKYYYLGIVVFLIGLGYILLSPNDSTFQIPNQNANQSQEATYIYIDIKGEVAFPGVYKIKSDYRLYQVIELAGGLTKDADILSINLAKKLNDEDIIVVKSIFDDDNTTNTLININTATKEQLITLKGIGDSLATAIITYRETISSFNNIEDLMNVSGIGEVLYSQIKDDIEV